MKLLSMSFYFRFALLLCFSLSITHTTHAQYLEKITEVTSTHIGLGAGDCVLYNYDDNMYLQVIPGPWASIIYDEQIYLGHRIDSLTQYRKRDYHFFQFDEDHQVVDHHVVDNGSRRGDFAKTRDHHALLIRNFKNYIDEDSTIVLTVNEGVEIDTPLHHLQGHILVFDAGWHYDYMHQLCIGEVVAIESSDSLLYFAAAIPDFDSLIVCNGDTIWNYKFMDSHGTNSQTIVVGTFNLHTQKYGWIWPFGGFGHDELWHFNRDAEGNLLMLLHAPRVHLPNGDTLKAHYTGNQAIKVSPTGEILFATDFIESSGEFLNSIYSDDEGNVYVSGLAGSFVNTQDSSLSSGTNFEQPLLYKFNAAGEEQWVRTLIGNNLDNLSYNRMAIGKEHLYLAGNLLDGTYELTGKSYSTGLGRNFFIQKIDLHTGDDVGHIHAEGESLTNMSALALDKDEQLHFIVNFKKAIDIQGIEIDHGSSRYAELIKVGQFWTDAKDVRQARSDLFSVYPNLVPRGTSIQVDYADQFPTDGELMLIDSQGFVAAHLSKGDVLYTHKLVAGQYVLIYLDEDSFQEEKIIIY